MACRCGAQMRRQSQGVFFCVKGDRFAVVVSNVRKGTEDTQWYIRDMADYTTIKAEASVHG